MAGSIGGARRYSSTYVTGRRALEQDRNRSRRATAPLRVEDPIPPVIPSPRAAFAALWRSLPFWRIAGIAGAFASLLLALGVGLLATRAAREPVLIAGVAHRAEPPGRGCQRLCQWQRRAHPARGDPGSARPSSRNLEVLQLQPWPRLRWPHRPGAHRAPKDR